MKNEMYPTKTNNTGTGGSSFSHTSKIIVLIVATFASFMTPFDSSIVNLAIPSIGKDLGGNIELLGWIPIAYLMALSIFFIPFGRLADIHGRKLIFVLGISTFVEGSLACSLSPSLPLLIAFRFIQGLGSAMMGGTAIALITSVFPPGERGKALGINTAAVYVGLSLGPPLGGFLVQYLGWRSIFYVNIPIGIIVIILTLIKIHEKNYIKDEKFDHIGFMLYFPSLTLIFLGLTLLQHTFANEILIIGILILPLFFTYEYYVSHPLIDVELFKNLTFTFSNITALLNYSSTYAISFIMSLYLQLILKLDPQYTGLILLSQPLLMAIFSPFGGWLSDKIEPRIIASIGMALISVSILRLSFLNINTSILDIVSWLMILGFGYALFSSPNTNAVMSSVERTKYGIASGILGTMRFTGQALSLAITVSIFSTITRTVITTTGNLQRRSRKPMILIMG
ncbi:MAG: MFS transporter [Thermoprotei archaeon]